MNKIFDLENPIQDKTHLEGEAYALLSFLQLQNAHTNEWELTMELPFDTMS